MRPDVKNKVKVLTFLGYYIPGYKAGGPIRTLANMADHLSEHFEFWIITRDRDQDESLAYDSVSVNTWQKVGNANVYYLSPDRCTVRGIARVVDSTPHDLVYLNSFFDPNFTLKPLLGWKFLKSTDKPIILAPRGEFSEGALSIKTTKKNIYIRLCSWIYRGITFHASSQYEKNDSLRNLSWLLDKNIFVAIDLPTKLDQTHLPPPLPTNPDTSSLRVIFLSRICRMKNLDYALAVLAHVTKNIKLDIYGPKEDPDYWMECESYIRQLPANIEVSYCGNVMPENVKDTFASYDLFFFPTKGENYGHVVAESISVGTPVLLSDQTPWRNLEKENLGWDLSLDDPLLFAKTIDNFASTPKDERQSQRVSVYKKALEKLSDSTSVELNKELFLSVLKNRKG
ncbi:glycosyltransferase [Pseudomonas protegens]|jgi:glycosyltransferase involved in cell wall biosynthesis|uniref:Glycosyltransferase, group 1 family n=2 Tax=Pseudomonas protegens TaxID=380021 RepID=Q4K6F1_PSEF5|nr:glycosyltransferase family 4 protein [Pseudomonas protegens]AAY94325.1 glycosyltransferase, group 1 family [Pseudomonas protegens Pf-5]ASE21501.1 group 1 family glycosyltransferase [Pseudomonas protegens]PNV99887.1 group 1 family glycosyltransferase [Pseudomonas protegens]QEZ54821.1 glycosyltransferase [Pseudomonas protegens]QEZ58981.1 glycosyltransferase [Pseudomonas protegens]